MRSSSANLRGIMAALGMALCWTGFNVVSRFAGRSTLTPFDVMAIRFTVSGLIALPFFLLRPMRLSAAQLLALALFGGLGYTFFAYTGFYLAPAADGGIVVNGGLPLLTALFSWVWLEYRPGPRALTALALTALGLVLLGFNSIATVDAGSDHRWLGDLCFLGAAACWGSYGILVRQWRVPALEATFGVVTTSLFLYLPIYLLFLPKTLPHVEAGMFWLQAFYQGVVAALLANVLFTTASVSIGPVKTSLILTVVPALSALAGVVLLQEALHATAAWGLVAVSVGAFLGAWQSDPKSR